MGDGIHNLEFDIDNDFFKEFEESHLDNGNFKVLIELDKKSDHSIMIFDVDGYTKTSCDRCLENIELPMYGEYKLLFKHSDEGENTDEIVYIHPETSILNLAEYVYEFILLSMPIIKAYDCENDEKPPCNFQVLDKLGLTEQDDSEDNSVKGVWNSLKDLKLNDKDS